MTKEELKGKTIVELRKVAKQEGVKNINSYKKKELVDVLIQKLNLDEDDEILQELGDFFSQYETMKINSLKKIASAYKIKGYSKMKKNELIISIKEVKYAELKNKKGNVDAPQVVEEREELLDYDESIDENKTYFTKAEEKKINEIVTELVENGKNNKNFLQDITIETKIKSKFGSEYDKKIFLFIEKTLDNKKIIIDYTSDAFANEIEQIKDSDDDEEYSINIENLTSGVGKKYSNDLVKQYLSSINDYPLLTKEKEAEYGKIISEYRENKENAPKEQAIKAQKAREELQLANKRLVVSVAKKYVNRGLDLIDLIHEGTIGLIRAIDKYDYKTGFKFSTYATWWVRQGITRAIADKSRAIRIPVHMVETINKVTKVQRELVQKLGQEPTYAQIGMAIKPRMSESQVEGIFKIARDPVYLEMPVGDDNSSLESFIEDDRNKKQDEYSEENELKKKILQIIEEIPDREGEVIKYRYGLYQLDTALLKKQVQEIDDIIVNINKQEDEMQYVQERIENLINFNSRQKSKYKKRIMQNRDKYDVKAKKLSYLEESRSLKYKKYLEEMENLKENNIAYLNSIKEVIENEISVLEKIDGQTNGIVKPLTLEEVGDLFNVTRERIRQIESKGRRKLKSYAEKEKLDLYL